MQNLAFSISSLLPGLIIGVLFSIVFWIQLKIKNKSRMKAYVEENERLKSHLNAQMQISAKGNEALQKELDEQRRMNENLRSTISTLKEKPGRDKLHVLYVYDKAIQLMFEKHPAFSTMWAGALKEAEYEIDKAHSGFLPLLKKVFKASPKHIAIKSISSEEEE